jgi:hypothetical protein
MISYPFGVLYKVPRDPDYTVDAFTIDVKRPENNYSNILKIN